MAVVPAYFPCYRNLPSSYTGRISWVKTVYVTIFSKCLVRPDFLQTILSNLYIKLKSSTSATHMALSMFSFTLTNSYQMSGSRLNFLNACSFCKNKTVTELFCYTFIKVKKNITFAKNIITHNIWVHISSTDAPCK